MEIKIDQAKMNEVKTLLAGIKGGAEKAIMRAINKSLAGIVTDATAEIAKEVNLTKKVIRGTLTTIKAKQNSLRGEVLSTHEAIQAYDKTKPWTIKNQAPGMHYSGAKLKKGYSFRFKKSHGKKKFKTAFAATMPSGHTGIWIRTGSKTKTGKAKLKEIYSSSPTEVFSNEERMEPILKAAGERLEKNLDNQVKFLLGK